MEFSYEAFARQDRGSVNKIQAIFQVLFDEISRVATINDDTLKTVSEELTEAVAKRFKLTEVKVNILNNGKGPIVFTPVVNQNHPFYKTIHRCITRYEKMDNKLGGVDRSKVTAIGAFTELPGIIDIGVGFLSAANATAEQATAMLCHEIGHILSYIDVAADAINLPPALAEATNPKVLNGTTWYKNETLKSIEKRYGLDFDKKSVATAVGANDPLGYAVVVTESWKMRHTSGLGGSVGYYTDEACEIYADDLVVKLGLAKPLAEALNSVYKLDKKVVLKNRFIYLAATVFMGVSAGVLAAIGSAGFTILAVIEALFFGLASASSSTDGRIPGYGKNADRVERLRQGLTAELKAAKGNSQLENAILDEIKIVDEIQSTLNKSPTIIEKITFILSSDARKKEKDDQFMQLLEHLVNNRLYEQSARLNQM